MHAAGVCDTPLPNLTPFCSPSCCNLGPSSNPRWLRAPSGVEGESKPILVQMHAAGVCDTPLPNLAPFQPSPFQPSQTRKNPFVTAESSYVYCLLSKNQKPRY